MRFGLKSAVVGAAAFAVLLASGGAALAKLSDLTPGTDDHKAAVKCFATIVKEGGKYAGGHAKLITKCKANIVKGKVPGPLSTCNPLTGDLGVKAAANAAKFAAKIEGKCCGKDKACGVGTGKNADIPLGNFNWDIGSCPTLEGFDPGITIADASDIAPCIVALANFANHQVMNDFGADLLDTTFFDGGVASKDDSKCEQTAFKEVGKFYGAKLKTMGKCWQAKAKQKGDDFGDGIRCPDTDSIKGKTQAGIAKIEQKIAKGLCGKCSIESGTKLKRGDGNKDGVCDGADKITPADVAAVDLDWFLGATCPSVIVPPSDILHRYDDTSKTPGGAYGDNDPFNGADCGAIGVIDTLQEYIDCVTCVAEYKADCLNAMFNGIDPASGMDYPSECLGAPPTPVCGDGVVSGSEACDPNAPSPQCGNAGNALQDCNPDCTCSCPGTVTFEADPNDPASNLDTGFTGFAHGAKVIGEGVVTVALSGGTSGVPGLRDPSCGVMDISGPLQNPHPNGGQIDVRRCSVDYSIPCMANSDCPGVENCITYFGSRLPLSAGGVSACVTNRFTAAIVGTADIETGDSANTVAISSEVVVGPSVDKPCDNCIADLVANDGSPDGTCDTGANAGAPCDVNGVSPIPAFNGGAPAPGKINGTSLDCPNTPLGSNTGILPINLSNSTGTESLTVQATGPTCTASGFGGSTCMCDTCATLAAEPCNADSDCPAAITCGGLRCLGGAAAGTACTIPGIGDPLCLGDPCGNLGELTKPNTCTNSTCVAGVCNLGPFNGFCTPTETFRGCILPSDCPFSGDTCSFLAQPCFDDNGVVGRTIDAVGAADVPVNDTSSPVLASVFCVQPVAAASINAASGLPGAGRVTLAGTANGLPLTCGNGVVDPWEACDPAAAGPQCPGAGNGLQDCNLNCTCSCPSVVTFQADPNDPASNLDTGFSGFAHGAKVIGEGVVTVALSGGTSGVPGLRDPSCGVMDISGPLQNPAAGAGQIDVRRCSVDHSITCSADSDCPGVETCVTYFGSRLPLSAGGVSACVTNRFTAPIVGTADIEAGDSANTVAISSEVVVGPSVDKPCDNCIGDLVANDGSADGTCDTGTRATLACDVNGISPIPAFNGGAPAPGTINGTSLDCTHTPLGSNTGILPINLSNSTGTESLTVQATGPTCTASGFGGSTCMCDTCATLAAEPCNADSDCPAAITCGGLRCLGGAAAGTACTIPGIGDPLCLGDPCGNLGELTKPNTCTNSTCVAGVCNLGPFNGFCTPTETFRGCILPSDCPFSGDTCSFLAQPCFDDNGVVGGTISATGAMSVPVNDTSSPVLASVFCVQPVAAASINAASGLPGAGRVTLAGTANGLP